MMEVKTISKNIAWDGKSFFCLHCGKAGFSSLAAVKGHQSVCPQRARNKGAVPTENSDQLPVRLPTATPSSYQLANGGEFAPFGSYHQQHQQLLDRLGSLESTVSNELTHLRQANYQSQGQGAQSWIQKNLTWVVLAGVFVFAVFLYTGGNRCPTQCDSDSGPKGPDLTKLGERVITKAADTAISKSFGRIFK